jgi:hypothetical protein
MKILISVTRRSVELIKATSVLSEPISLAASAAMAALAVGLTLAPSPARAFTMTFNELGTNCMSTVGTCSSTVEADPSIGPLVPSGQNVLVFTLPALTFSGNVNILDPSGAISDRLRWIDASGSSTACEFSSGLSPCANRMIFYSLDSNGVPADVGAISLSTTSNTARENANGTFSFVTESGVNTYDGTSAGTVPIPAALPLFATGLGGLGLLGWRRKRKAQAV